MIPILLYKALTLGGPTKSDHSILFTCFCLFLTQYCAHDYQIKYTVSSRRPKESGFKYHGQRSFSGCHETGIYHDVAISSDVDQIIITLTKLWRHVALNELEFYIGQDDPSSLVSSNLQQDASRTWIRFDSPVTQYFELDVLEIRGKAHVGVQNDKGDVQLEVAEYKGDFTGVLHIGKGQTVNFTLNNNSLLPFSVNAYQVIIK